MIRNFNKKNKNHIKINIEKIKNHNNVPIHNKIKKINLPKQVKVLTENLKKKNKNRIKVNIKKILIHNHILVHN